MKINPITLFRERLWVKVVSILTLILIAVISVTIGFNIRSQNESIHEQSRFSSHMLTAAIEGSTFDALGAGRNNEVVLQLSRLKEKHRRWTSPFSTSTAASPSPRSRAPPGASWTQDSITRQPRKL